MTFEKELASLLMPEILERQASYSPRENRRVSKRGQKKLMKHNMGKMSRQADVSISSG